MITPGTMSVRKKASQPVIAAVRFMQVKLPQYVHTPGDESAMRKTGIHAITLLEVHKNVQCSWY